MAALVKLIGNEGREVGWQICLEKEMGGSELLTDGRRSRMMAREIKWVNDNNSIFKYNMK